MFKKYTLVLFVSFFFLAPFCSFASVVINEVQLAPTENRFIELYNTSNSEVDLTGFYIQRKTQTGTSFTSLVSNTNFENKKISGNGYFLISRESMQGADIVLGNMTLTDSNVIQIKNSEGEVVDKICWGEVSDCTDLKTSNPAEGKSISRQNNSLVVGFPTPGKINVASSGVESQTNNTQNNNTSNTQTENSIEQNFNSNTNSTNNTNQNTTTLTLQNQKEGPRVKLKINTKSLGFANIPHTFEARAYNQNDEMISFGKYVWNFGDGSIRENKNVFLEKFTHTYFYKGDYAVSFEYYSGDNILIPDIVGKINIKIVEEPKISISNTGGEKDFFIELTNNSDYEILLENWKILSKNRIFIFPKLSTIIAKSKIILPPQLTGFALEDKETLKLFDNKGVLVFSLLETQNTNTSTEKKIINTKSGQNINTKNTEENLFFSNQILDLENNKEGVPLGAESQKADALSSVSEYKNNDYFFFVLILALLGGVGIYFIRKNKKEFKEGDDFEILEE